MQTFLGSVKKRSASSPPSRPTPLCFMPPKVPHSPQRFENTVGLVVERKRLPEELDGFMWYCNHCNNLLYEEYLYVDDIVGQLPPVFDRFYGSEENRTCDQCGTVMPPRD